MTNTVIDLALLLSLLHDFGVISPYALVPLP
jgi:hypothetical protein